MTTILIVEDNAMNLAALQRRLTRRGFSVISATDGEEGVRVAQAQRPHLILMDMSLPVLDGWEATRRLKAMHQMRSTPIIALTAHAMASDKAKCMEAGCDDYDTKPVEFQRLLTKIGTALEKGARK